jgi:hypothetical protein
VFVTSPFTQPAVVGAAMGFSKADCVQARPAEGGASSSAPQLLGKMPLRLACPEVPVRWRRKDPIEVRGVPGGGIPGRVGGVPDEQGALQVQRKEPCSPSSKCRASAALLPRTPRPAGWVRHHGAQRSPLAARARHRILQHAHQVGCINCSAKFKALRRDTVRNRRIPTFQCVSYRAAMRNMNGDGTRRHSRALPSGIRSTCTIFWLSSNRMILHPCIVCVRSSALPVTLLLLRSFRCRQAFPGGEVPGKPRHGADPCPCCGWQLSSPDQTFCVTCGHYDANMRTGQESAT